MEYGGLNKGMDAAAEIGRSPVSKRHIQPECGENGQADAGRNALNPPRETIFSCANEDRKIFIFPCSADHEQEWQPCLVDPYSATYVMTIHTY